MRSALIIFLSILLGIGCTIKVTEQQIITIDHYEDVEKNQRLLEALVRYDPEYLVKNIPRLNKDMLQTMSIGMFQFLSTDADGEQVAYRVTYPKNNPEIDKHLPELKKQFEAFIVKTEQQLVDRQALFESLELQGQEIAEQTFSDDSMQLYENASPKMHEFQTPKGFKRFVDSLRDAYGSATAMSYLFGQYYEEFLEVPEVIVLQYIIEFADDKAVWANVSLTENEGEWRLIGIRFWDVNSDTKKQYLPET